MDYRNLVSTQATINSYLEAFNKLKAYCENVEPCANEFNGRTVLPTQWIPVDRNSDVFRKDANYLHTEHASLMEYGRPRFIEKGYFDYRQYFKVSWQIRFPFNIYAWDMAHAEYVNDSGKTIPYVPAKMVEWCSPLYMSLGEISGWSMKSWALPDWWVKHTEIESFMDDNLNLKEQYRKAVTEADKEVKTWQESLQTVSNLITIFDSKIAKDKDI